MIVFLSLDKISRLKKNTSGEYSGPGFKTSPSSAGDAGLIPSQGGKIPQALWPRNQNRKQKECCNKFNKNLKMVHIKKKKKSLKKNPTCATDYEYVDSNYWLHSDHYGQWSRFSVQRNRKAEVLPDHVPNRANVCTSCFVVDGGRSQTSSQSALNSTWPVCYPYVSVNRDFLNWKFLEGRH